MEHQSAVAYGNEFQNGYLGRDLSGSGWGMKWDFIIVHESGHEWFGNNITTRDIADMWVHEGFTSYSETLFTEYWYGKEAGEAYLQGLRRNIANKETVIGPYGVNREGSGDMYYKGSNMLHTIRHVIGNDTLFRQILRGLNSDFYRQTVTSRQVEEYISKRSGRDLSKIFDQYLRNTNIPTLELQTTKTGIRYRWANSIPGFNMPIRVNAGRWITLQPKEGQWQTLSTTGMTPGSRVEVDKNFYVNVKG
jgi:aminopeptidase N